MGELCGAPGGNCQLTSLTLPTLLQTNRYTSTWLIFIPSMGSVRLSSSNWGGSRMSFLLPVGTQEYSRHAGPVSVSRQKIIVSCVVIGNPLNRTQLEILRDGRFGQGCGHSFRCTRQPQRFSFPSVSECAIIGCRVDFSRRVFYDGSVWDCRLAARNEAHLSNRHQR
jgi:hypothetical protein